MANATAATATLRLNRTAVLMSVLHASRSRPGDVLLIKGLVLVVNPDVAPTDDHVRDGGLNLERIALRDEEIGDLARLDRADPIRHTEDLGRVDSQRLDRVV